MRTETELDVRPIGGNIGAEIHGLDVTALSEDTIAAIRSRVARAPRRRDPRTAAHQSE